MEPFENVTVLPQANLYFEGRVSSRTLLLADGTRKTLGVILPGEYEFGTAAAEHMEMLAGALRARLPGSDAWVPYAAGESFDVPANSRFRVLVDTFADYCCTYLPA